jgi:predicted TIM-barrel fold metal-dependent hydrolase
MVRQAEEMVDDGVRAFLLPAGSPPAGTSPADRALEPFWSICEDRNIPITFHLGTEFAFLASMNWSANVPEFSPAPQSTVEFQIEPYRTATFHFCMENYLTAMILGGVLERHPMLRIGVMETAAHWVGPMGKRLDITATQFKKRLSGTLSMEPSKYLARNVRVAPFPFEPVGDYLRDHPEMSAVYSFMTDFPHVEGGSESEQTYATKLAGFDEDVRRGFFRENGLFLTPD